MIYDALVKLVGKPHGIDEFLDIFIAIETFPIGLDRTYFLENISVAMCSRKLVTYQINKIIPVFKFFCEFTVGLDSTFVLTTLEAIVFDNRSDLGFELAADM